MEDEEAVRRALTRAALAAPPMSLDVPRQLALGARRRRARRWGAGVAAVACLAVLGVGGAAALDRFDRPVAPLVGSQGNDEHQGNDELWPVGGDATAPAPAPSPTPGWHTTDLDELFAEHPDEWGGAYYDDDGTLVVKSVWRTAPAAAAYLQGLGVPADVVVEQAGPAISDYARAGDALTSDEQLATQVYNVEADYRSSGLIVTARDDSDHPAVARRISDVLDASGVGIPVIAVHWLD